MPMKKLREPKFAVIIIKKANDFRCGDVVELDDVCGNWFNFKGITKNGRDGIALLSHEFEFLK